MTIAQQTEPTKLSNDEKVTQIILLTSKNQRVGTHLVILKCCFLLIFAGCGGFTDYRGIKRLEHGLSRWRTPKDDGLCALNDPKRIEWQRRAKLVQIGMRRTEVERLLPPYEFPENGPHPSTGMFMDNVVPGKRQYEWYYVSPEFIVSLYYDYTGPFPNRGLPLIGMGPNQRILDKVVIYHFDFRTFQ
jgi:hypothetical protein